MQFVLELDDRPTLLLEAHLRLEGYFGRQGPFAKPDPVSQLALSLLGCRTRDAVSRRAFESLLFRFRRWENVRDAPVREIRVAIAGVTNAEVKAPRLKSALRQISQKNGSLSLDNLHALSVEDALAWLERLPGVGRKVAAATLNFTTLRKPALVLDTHHLRILARLGFITPSASTERAYTIVTPLLPRDWSAAELDDHHQLMKTLGQRRCRQNHPRCSECPLEGLCPVGAARRDARVRSRLFSFAPSATPAFPARLTRKIGQHAFAQAAISDPNARRRPFAGERL